MTETTETTETSEPSGSHDPGPFVFDWQREPENFLKWLIPNIIVGIDPATYRSLSAATDRFTRVELTMQVNGVELDTRSAVRGIEDNLDHAVRRAVAERLTELAEVTRLRELLDETERAFEERLRELAREAGIELGDREG